MRINKGKRCIPCERYPLPRRLGPQGCAHGHRRCSGQNRVQIDMGRHQIRRGVQQFVEPRQFLGLHQPQMPFWQFNCGQSRQSAQNPDARRLDPGAQEPLVAR